MYEFVNEKRGLQRLPTVKSVEAKIESFRHFERGWHYGSGGPSPQKVVDDAILWSLYLKGLRLYDLDAFAGDSGEILLSAIKDDHSIDVIVEVDGSVSVAYDRNDVQESYRPRMSAIDAQNMWQGWWGFKSLRLHHLFKLFKNC